MSAEECEDGVFGSQDIADALGGRGPDSAEQTSSEGGEGLRLTEAEWMPVEDRLIALWQCETEAGFDEFAGRVHRAVEHILTSRLAAVRREAGAKALTEAADDLGPDDHRCFRPQGCVDCGRQKERAFLLSWLRDRAARMGGDS